MNSVKLLAFTTKEDIKIIHQYSSRDFLSFNVAAGVSATGGVLWISHCIIRKKMVPSFTLHIEHIEQCFKEKVQILLDPFFVLRNNSVCEIVCVFCSETKCLVPTQQH
jgi:hypothetical protein